jgi:hypothetical protein
MDRLSRRLFRPDFDLQDRHPFEKLTTDALELYHQIAAARMVFAAADE